LAGRSGAAALDFDTGGIGADNEHFSFGHSVSCDLLDRLAVRTS
jgi:hypothetical protein